MTSFGVTIKNEITRLSRKELRTQVEPLRKATSTFRKDIAALKREVSVLQRQLATLTRSATKAITATTTEAKPTRFAAKGLRALRTRLGISATDFGKLAGASGQSVYNWESGKAVPRQRQLTVLAGLRGLSKKEAQARLVEGSRTSSRIKRTSGKSSKG
jgi:DNA-binding transcriptional regulator YiaG